MAHDLQVMMESMFKQATSGDVEDFKHLQMDCATPSSDLEPTMVLSEGRLRNVVPDNLGDLSWTPMQFAFSSYTSVTATNSKLQFGCNLHSVCSDMTCVCGQSANVTTAMLAHLGRR